MLDLITTGNHEAVRSEVDHAIARLMEHGMHRATRHGAEVRELWALAADHLRGGKLVRPLLLVEVFDGLRAAAEAATPEGSGDDAPVAERSEVLRLAAAIEVLHYAFLLHDDVIDNDLTRRGRPNLVGALLDGDDLAPAPAVPDQQGSVVTSRGTDSEDDHRVAQDPARARRAHWARSSAVLVGDQMLALAHQIFARVDLPRPAHRELMEVLEDAVVDSAVGEFLDVSLSDGVIEPAEDVIDEMTRTKTATYTLELPLRMASVLAGAPAEVQRALAEAGRHLGIAFQLQDDALSAFGSALDHGKDPWSDLREGKQTAITEYARRTEAWPRIAAALEQDSTVEERGERVRTLLLDCGAREHQQMLIDREVESARDVLEDCGHRVPGPVARVLRALIDELENRSR
ncbi:geranylgeranyl pyrophosphate synthase [Brachybacterium endophyticum]|uniref:Geranylgeranyl pyrophosphate synthase n=1 Tax=Brachybacterium endophyticum TaxID=2182385 RepID=A0A2U2RKJ9_9MICO|nr:polyprenyl synthetase family protein [Brachybacterium endophyticum]PWH06335.1 geranylgeranyl pyrophosphate synthase [Brachybacterium endophyticum]